MKHEQVVFTGDFSVITGNARSQAAVMILPVGTLRADRRIVTAGVTSGSMSPPGRAPPQSTDKSMCSGLARCCSSSAVSSTRSEMRATSRSRLLISTCHPRIRPKEKHFPPVRANPVCLVIYGECAGFAPPSAERSVPRRSKPSKPYMRTTAAPSCCTGTLHPAT